MHWMNSKTVKHKKRFFILSLLFCLTIKKFGIPGLLYLFKIVGFPNNSERFNRQLQTVAELGDQLAQQFSNLTTLKRLATIDEYFKQLNGWHQELAFGTMRDSKVREQKV